MSNEGARGRGTRVLTCACRCVRLMPGSALRSLCMLCAGLGSLCNCFSALHKLLSFAGPCWQILLPDWRIARSGRPKTEYKCKIPTECLCLDARRQSVLESIVESYKYRYRDRCKYSFCGDKACWTCIVPTAMYSLTNRVGLLRTMPIVRFASKRCS